MFGELAEFEDGATVEADVVIIGGGAVGITMGRELIDSGRDVWIIESGGIEFDAPTQALYEGENAGVPYFPLDAARLRFFGGTTNHWDGHCRPLDPIDFEKRDWMPHSGWPLSRAELDPFYARAQKICEIGPFEYDPQKWPVLRDKLIDFAPEKIRNRVWQFGPPTRFGEVYRDALKKARNVRVLMHGNAVDIGVGASGQEVEQVTLKNLAGKTVKFRPRVLILAAGGIENVRLLLSSDSVERAGIGNRNDLVGRFFMEHPHALGAFAVRQVPLERFVVYYDRLRTDSAVFRVKPGVSEEVQRQRRILNGCFDLGYGYDRSEGYLAMRSLGKAFSAGRLPEGLGSAVLDVVGDLDGAAVGLYRKMRDENVLWFATCFEQVPNPDSRITLTQERDALGLRKVKLDWRFSDLDKRSAREGCRLIGEELARLGLARMHIDPWLLSDGPEWGGDVEGRYHHIGVTRMSDSPRTGVVDRDGRVHGMSNLYVTGSSIFPTSGYANPTLTIVALAIRLADQLKGARHG